MTFRSDPCPRCAGWQRQHEQILAHLRAVERRLDEAQTAQMEQQAVIRALREHLREDNAELRRVEIERDNALEIIRNHK
jgi:hypothetical protein